MPLHTYSQFFRLPRLSVAGWLLAMGLISATLCHGHEGFLITNETAPVFQKIPEIESRLYGHTYPNQAISQRVSRIERTLFGRSQGGVMEARMQRIETRISEDHSKESLSEQTPLIEYLERKLFQRTHERKPLEERVHQLETHVFGKAFTSYPLAIRVKKLTYAMPLMSKEIRLTKGDSDMVIASTRRLNQLNTPTGPAKVEAVHLDATGSLIRKLPNGAPVSSGDYFQAIYRKPEGNMLRWASLPIRVYIKPGATAAENHMTLQALRAWQSVFSVEQVNTGLQADVLISWSAEDWEQNPSGLITRPVLQLGEQKNVRAVILISMAPQRQDSMANQLHTLSHQLGHAFGLWGHSDNPDDVMYPLLKSENRDFPGNWGWRSAHPRHTLQPVEAAASFQPSQRDINTLLKVYDQPATDLSAYDPYMRQSQADKPAAR